MADTVDSKTLSDADRNVIVRRTCNSDGTGESNAVFMDISTFSASAHGETPLSLRVDRIDWDIQGFTSVTLNWDATTDDEIVKLGPGFGSMSWPGGMSDPRSSGYTGDILITTAGPSVGDTYTITLYCVKKY